MQSNTIHTQIKQKYLQQTKYLQQINIKGSLTHVTVTKNIDAKRNELLLRNMKFTNPLLSPKPQVSFFNCDMLSAPFLSAILNSVGILPNKVILLAEERMRNEAEEKEKIRLKAEERLREEIEGKNQIRQEEERLRKEAEEKERIRQKTSFKVLLAERFSDKNNIMQKETSCCNMKFTKEGICTGTIYYPLLIKPARP